MGVFFISMMIVVRIAFCELRERAEAGVLLFIVTKSLKQNTELPLHASEQDTSLVSRSIKKESSSGLFFYGRKIKRLKRHDDILNANTH